MRRILFIILCSAFVPVVCFAGWEARDVNGGIELYYHDNEIIEDSLTYYKSQIPANQKQDTTDVEWAESVSPLTLGTNAEIDDDVYLTVMEGHADVPTDPDVWGEPDEEVHTSSEWVTISAGQAELNTEMMFDINGMEESMDFMGIYTIVLGKLTLIIFSLFIILTSMWIAKMVLQYIKDDKVTLDYDWFGDKFKQSKSKILRKIHEVCFEDVSVFIFIALAMGSICIAIALLWPLACLLIALYIPLRTARFLNRVNKGLGKIAKVAHKHVDNLNQQDIEIEGPKF